MVRVRVRGGQWGWVFARTSIPTGTKTPEQPTNLKIPSPRLLKVLEYYVVLLTLTINSHQIKESVVTRKVLEPQEPRRSESIFCFNEIRLRL